MSALEAVLETKLECSPENVGRAFSLAADQYDHYAALQLRVAGQLLSSLLKECSRQFSSVTRILDVGCGTGLLAEALALLFPKADIVAIDVAEGMVRVAQQRLAGYSSIHVCQADAMQSLTHLGKFDLVVSSFTLHWCGTPQRWLRRLSEVVVPGGGLLLAMPTAGSLSVLRQAWQQVDDECHVNTFPEVAAVQEAIERLSLTRLSSGVMEWRQFYSSLKSLLYALKAMGANTVLDRRAAAGVASGLRGRTQWATLEAAFSNYVQGSHEPFVLDYRVWRGLLRL